MVLGNSRNKFNLMLFILLLLMLHMYYKQTNQNDIKLNKNVNAILDTVNLATNSCDHVPHGLIGKFARANNTSAIGDPFSKEYSTILPFMKRLEIGGKWKPSNCKSRHRVAIIIPYRDRLDNLKEWLINMHPYLQRQELEYGIFVVEQEGNEIFNKGILMNTAFNFIFNSNNNEFDCVLYHDVDLLPTDDLNIYGCPDKQPRHFSILVDHHDYRTEYPILVGGAIVYSPQHFIKVNGYSNMYWGWGAEDDDMYYRLKKTKVSFSRPTVNTRYVMLRHATRWRNPKRVELINKSHSNHTAHVDDGLNNVKSVIKRVDKLPLITHILVNSGTPPKELIGISNANSP